ncbi:MAG: hypothetical protein V3U11_05835, partial [Planctomycetota bacterium]
MKRIPILVPILALAPLTAQQPAAEKSVVPDDAPPGFVKITADALKERASYLASDALGGRLTGSPGQIKAAEYLVKHFQKLGLVPLGDKKGRKRTWYQKYAVQRTYLLPKTSLKVSGKTFKKGFAVIPAKGQNGDKAKDVSTSGVLVYAGRVGGRGGNEALGGLRGKLPVVVLKTPKSSNTQQQFGIAFTLMRRMSGKARSLADDGARAVIFCLLDDDAGLSSALTYMSLIPGKDLMARGRDRGMAGQVEQVKGAVPWIITSRRISDAVLKALKLDAEQVLEPLDDDVLKASRKTRARAKVQVAVRRDAKAHAVNVCGVLRGSDTILKNEAV